MLGRTIIVHAKLAIIDDMLLRIGSSNMNNRSSGFDTECDLSIEAEEGDPETRQAIAGIRGRLVSHWLGCPQTLVEDTVETEGSLGKAIEALRNRGLVRLRPIEAQPLGPFASFNRHLPPRRSDQSLGFVATLATQGVSEQGSAPACREARAGQSSG